MRCYLYIILLLLTFFQSFSQSSDSTRFETDYRNLLENMEATGETMDSMVKAVENKYLLTDLQKSRLYYIKTKIYSLNFDEDNKDVIADPVVDSCETLSMLNMAVKRIIQSRTAIGIPLLQEYLASADPDSDSAVYARIYLAEGYRKIGEYQKGIEVIYDVLDKKYIALKNKAFAYHRLAALYDECASSLYEHRHDSVFKYCNLCIDISERNGFMYHLATAQNELGYYYWLKMDYSGALDLFGNAFDNFIKVNQIADAINARYNTARTYYEMARYRAAIDVLLEAEKLIHENVGTNIFTKVYIELARNYHKIGQYKSAYEYLNIARKMQVELFKERIEANIYDMSAKYEAEKKEKENLRLRMENEINEVKISSKNATIAYLFTGILFVGVLLFVIYFLYYQKKKALDILVKRNLEIVDTEKEFQLISQHFSEMKNQEPDQKERNINQKGDLLDLKERLEIYMKNEKPYLFSDITINDIGQKLNTNRTYISKLVNDHYNKNFNDFINEYRIKTARQLLADPSKNHISIEGIGQMSGFNSRSTFFACFKKYTGITPSYFRQSIK